MRVLVIEDEQKVARALRQGLQGEHYDVEVAETGEDGFFRSLDAQGSKSSKRCAAKAIGYRFWSSRRRMG